MEEIEPTEIYGAFLAPEKQRGNPMCQVVGCTNRCATAYHKRYRICRHHASLPSIRIEGNVYKFCQQCGRFQDLALFDGDKKTCRDRLKKHNEQRKRARDRARRLTPFAQPEATTQSATPVKTPPSENDVAVISDNSSGDTSTTTNAEMNRNNKQIVTAAGLHAIAPSPFQATAHGLHSRSNNNLLFMSMPLPCAYQHENSHSQTHRQHVPRIVIAQQPPSIKLELSTAPMANAHRHHHASVPAPVSTLTGASNPTNTTMGVADGEEPLDIDALLRSLDEMDQDENEQRHQSVPAAAAWLGPVVSLPTSDVADEASADQKEWCDPAADSAAFLMDINNMKNASAAAVPTRHLPGFSNTKSNITPAAAAPPMVNSTWFGAHPLELPKNSIDHAAMTGDKNQLAAHAMNNGTFGFNETSVFL